MNIGDKIPADKIEGRQEILRNREDLAWALDVFGIGGFRYLIVVGNMDAPEAIYGLQRDHYQTDAQVVYLNEQVKCGRAACNNVAHPKARNSETKRFYCIPCARKIDESAKQTLGRSLYPDL